MKHHPTPPCVGRLVPRLRDGSPAVAPLLLVLALTLCAILPTPTAEASSVEQLPCGLTISSAAELSSAHYSYTAGSPGVLTIKSATPVTISGATTAAYIVVDPTSGSADVTLDGVNIDLTGQSIPVFRLNLGKKSYLTLLGDNRLKGGGPSGQMVYDGIWLQSGQLGAGTETELHIRGAGSLYAYGNSAAGIGGPGTVTITSGVISADGTGTYGQGVNTDAFTLNGNAVLYAKSVGGIKTLTKGVLFTGTSGYVYGTGVTISSYDLTVPAGYTLTVSNDLTIGEGCSLVNNNDVNVNAGGTINNYGTIANAADSQIEVNPGGQIDNRGRIDDYGTIHTYETGRITNRRLDGQIYIYNPPYGGIIISDGSLHNEYQYSLVDGVYANIFSGDAGVDGEVIAAPLILTEPDLPDGTVRVPYSAPLTAGGNGTMTWERVSEATSLPGGLALEQAEEFWVISGDPTTEGTFSFTLSVNNEINSYPDERDFTLTILPPLSSPDFVTNSALAQAWVGENYEAVIEAIGNPAPTLSLTSGTLPAGLVFTSGDGKISGTPSEPGLFEITIKAENTVGQADKTFTLEVRKAPTVITPAVGELEHATKGSDYSVTFSADSYPAPTSWSLTGSLPDGLAFADGTLSGTPKDSGVFSFSVTASLGEAPSVTSNLTLEVYEAPSSILPVNMPDGTVGKEYPDTHLTVEPGYPESISWTRSGTIPPGLALSEGGVISGTPTAAGTFNFTVTATNTAGSAHQGLTIIVEATTPGAPTIGTAVPGDGTATVSFTAPEFTGGSPITGYSVYTSDDARVGEGTSSPITVRSLTNGTSYRFKVRAENESKKEGAFSALSNVVTPVAAVVPVKPVIGGTGELPLATLGRQYFVSLDITGSPTPTVALLKGTLPPGLTLSENGVISGTPTTAGAFSFTVNAENAGGSVSKDFTLTVATVPNASMDVTATASADGSVVIEFTPPLGTGGSEVLFYTVTPYPYSNGVRGDPKPGVVGVASPITVSNLPAGDYVFAVAATNESGRSDSAWSNVVTVAAIEHGDQPVVRPLVPDPPSDPTQPSSYALEYAPQANGRVAVLLRIPLELPEKITTLQASFTGLDLLADFKYVLVSNGQRTTLRDGLAFSSSASRLPAAAASSSESASDADTYLEITFKAENADAMDKVYLEKLSYQLDGDDTEYVQEFSKPIALSLTGTTLPVAENDALADQSDSDKPDTSNPTDPGTANPTDPGTAGQSGSCDATGPFAMFALALAPGLLFARRRRK
jgi:hypothetical protein